MKTYNYSAFPLVSVGTIATQAPLYKVHQIEEKGNASVDRYQGKPIQVL